MPTTRITPEQLRAARGLLKISQCALAMAAGVAETTISYFEAGRTSALSDASADAVERFLIEQGVDATRIPLPGSAVSSDLAPGDRILVDLLVQRLAQKVG